MFRLLDGPRLGLMPPRIDALGVAEFVAQPGESIYKPSDFNDPRIEFFDGPAGIGLTIEQFGE
ncbi:hypothetical protein [Rhodopila sp.]|uniref:hypothetical protein n=1 Tax=Rhodopila sp. TaxID=2480087 RepID=UPI003D0FAA1E